ncbi:hypothetical protein V6N13_113298 [Hibiscus sabdariffa]|uniref:Uncharacterized protein n=2 Tax=Hibiscus sabdariffa TaxID=183260 RepID=A0ABR1ZBD9_9ROSI
MVIVIAEACSPWTSKTLRQQASSRRWAVDISQYIENRHMIIVIMSTAPYLLMLQFTEQWQDETIGSSPDQASHPHCLLHLSLA